MNNFRQRELRRLRAERFRRIRQELLSANSNQENLMPPGSEDVSQNIENQLPDISESLNNTASDNSLNLLLFS